VQPDEGVATADAELVRAAAAGDRRACEALYDRHAAHVARVLARILGHDPDLSDLLHDAFMVALRRLAELESPELFRPWLTRIAVFHARNLIRKRTRGRWLRLLSGEDRSEEPMSEGPHDEVSEALRAVYAVLAKMPVDERIAFTLRRIDGMELGELAAACDVSLSTIKRRLRRAEELFHAEAMRHPCLLQHLSSNAAEEVTGPAAPPRSAAEAQPGTGAREGGLR
jgi:RNA polymerase sigma-70 factor (ECF subfamily)